MPSPISLTLSVVDYAGPLRWRWLLTDASGAFVADHEVHLEAGASQLSAFFSLRSYVDARAIPESVEENTLVREVASWITDSILGGVARAIAERSPQLVLVSVPLDAKALAYAPLDLALVDGKPLAAYDITFIYDIATKTPRPVPPANEGPIRVLAIYSLPTNASVLDLRRERHELKRLLKTVAATQRVRAS